VAGGTVEQQPPPAEERCGDGVCDEVEQKSLAQRSFSIYGEWPRQRFSRDGYGVRSGLFQSG
jgi:hypothetical protein